ncbi:MAG: hypothetical protein ACR2NO_08060 [Chloroflexota bacterium]
MQAVPLGFFLFLAEFAVGVLVITALLDWDGTVSGGFLFLNGIFALAAVASAIWLRRLLPAERLVTYAAGRPLIGAEVAFWALFALLGAVQLFCIRSDRRRAGRFAGLATGAVGVGALAVSAGAYGSAIGGAPVLFAALAAGALAQGAVWSGMMLGHWYLVTPLLAPRPLLRLNAGMAGVLVFQAALAAWAMAFGQIEPSVRWLYWLRVGVGIVLPLALALPIWRTARVRSMMSATGLLYVALGFVLAGEIIARSFFFLTGLPT